jgi:hypothetical protein
MERRGSSLAMMCRWWLVVLAAIAIREISKCALRHRPICPCCFLHALLYWTCNRAIACQPLVTTLRYAADARGIHRPSC